MKKILLIFSLILAIFCRPAFAAEIDLENIDAEYVFVGGSATITFDVFQGEPNQTYKYIFFGGQNDTNSINTFNPVSNQFLSINDDWTPMPSFTTNSNGYSRIEGIFSIPSDKNFCSSIDNYCYQIYVGIYNTATAQEDSYSTPQPFIVLPLNFFSITPIPTPTPSLSPTINPTSTTTVTPTSTVISTNSSVSPTFSPTPTVNPTKFKTIASSSASLITPITTLLDNSNETDTNLTTIQTGSNPEREKTEILGVYKPTYISNLSVKIFFIFLLTSISFTLYCLCFFDYTFRDLLPEINNFFSTIKPQSKKVLFILKKLLRIIFQYFQTIFKAIKTYLKNSQIIKKYFKLIYQKFIIFLKFCLKISQKIIKYFSHFFNQFFIFIKEHIHIKIPRKFKRYLYHKRSHTLSLIFLVFVGIFFIKPIFASIGPKINRNDITTTENNFSTQDINLEPKQDFSWGVLSFNSNKSIYSLGETANLSMAVLDDKGAVVCDALLKLEIVMPDKTKEIFTTEDKQIKINSQCSSQEVTSIPDYQSFLKLTQIGEYQVILTAETKNGKYSIQDLFRVVQNSLFSVERISATRIYPLNSYPVNIKITANKDFEGTIVEKVPLSFTINQTDAKIETKQDNQLLKWNVKLKKDESITVNYTYKAPETSPERYLLGPINMLSDSKTIFQENRTWQIASDTPGFSNGILLFVTNGTIFKYKLWDGTQFGSTLPGPTLTGNGVVRHLASAVSDDGDYVGVVAEVYNLDTGTTGLHSIYGTVWDVDAGQWINTSLLWSFIDSTADNIHQRYFNITALGNDEFVVVGKEDPGLTLNNAGWLAGTGWTVETDLTTIGSVGKFVELIRRPGTTNLLLCTKDEASDTNCRYYKGATPYGTSANINDDWTGNTEIMTLSDDPQNWDSHAFFDPTDNTRGAIIHNPNSASGLTIAARKFTVTDTVIGYGTTAFSAALSDDYNRSLVAPIPGRSEALVLGAGILEDLKAYRVGVTATAPNWTTITPNLEGNAGLHVTTLDINFNWAMEFDGTRGVVAWAQVGTTNPVHFRRWTIDGNFEASEQNINGSPNNGYDRTMIARRDPIATDEILFIAVNDDVDVSTAWWDGSADSFYTSGNKAWTEQVAGLSTAIQDSFWSVEFQFFPNPSPAIPSLISPVNNAIGVTQAPTFSLVTTDPYSDPLQYKLILSTDSDFVGTTQVFDQTVSNVGWSGQNVGTSAYSSGSTASYIIQSALSDSTMYYWKAQAIDYSGSNTWSSLSIGYSFTTSSGSVASTAPAIPTLVSPSTGTTAVSLTPSFTTVTTDANSDNLQYELKICTDSGMSANCQTFDQTSSNVGWSGQDVGTSAYSSGTTATYILQVGNSLVENTIYYWKTRAKDYAGTGTWSSTQATTFSFATNTRPNTPTLVTPGTGTTAVSQTPTLKTVTTDIDKDSLQYKIELATDDAFTQNLQTFDLSSSSTGWSGIDVGTSAYASGTTAVYIIPIGSSLASSTTYYWRSYAKDITGTTRWSGTQGTVFSFTTITPFLVQATFRWSDDDASGEVRSIGTGDTWYDSNYDYRAPITVTNNVGTSLTDFQVRLTIGTSALVANGKMRSDCNDIRFTDNDKETPLNYYIESGCNSTSDAIVWIKVPTLAASTTRDIYFYYGYSSASAASNGDNTFDAHDDFSGTSIDTNKWHDWNPQSWGTVTISGGTLAINGTSTGGVEKSRGLISNSQFSFSNHIIEMSSKWITLGDINTNGYYQKTTAFRIGESYPSTNIADNNYNFLYIRYNGLFNVETHYYEFNKTISGSNSQVASSNLTNDDPANFETIKYHYYTGPNQRAYRSINGGSSFSSLWTATNSNSISTYYGPLISAKQSTDGDTTTFFDWFRIRKYASSEPTFSLGTETTEPPPAGSSGATWLEAENVGVTGISPSENIRLRFSVANTGAIDSANFRLQVAPKGASSNCTDVSSGNFTDVTTTVGSNLAVMTTSPNFTNQEATTNQLTDSSTTFVAGKMVEYDSNQSDSISLNTNEFTEVEYNFQMTNNIGATTPYCFRVVDAGSTLSTYTNVAQLTTIYVENNSAPSAPYLPYVNNTTAQSGQQSPVYGLIDHTPAFSAVFDDPNTSNTAAYYQLQIGSDSDWASAEIWDSTKTAVSGTCNENSRCGDIVYSGGTSLVDGSTYYWRLKYWDNLDVGGTWSDTLQFSMNNTPSVGNVVINGNNSINLSENSSIGISWVATVTDADGYTNLDSATGKLYRSGVGQSCTLDNNNCYTDTTCSFENCDGNSCSAVCSADIYFFTDATDTGSTFVDQYYQGWIEATDIRTEIGSTISSSILIDINTLSAFSIGQSLIYGEVFAGSDTGSSNTVVTVTNTGNSLINLEITGDYMCTDYPSCGGNNIEPHYQEYNINNFTYGTGTTLSASPAIINIGISKPTQSPSNSTKNLYWGIGIPSVKPPGNYQGAVTILVD